MRLIAMGTGPFAAPMFRALYAAGHDIAALVTRPPRNVRERYKGSESLLPAIAAEHGTPVLMPEDANSPESLAELAALGADLLVVCDYGQILSPAALAVTRHGGINLHGSLLPKYRGAAPINWAIANGETETGVTVIHMTPGLDAGPCIAQAATPIGGDETVVHIETRLAQLGGPLVCQAIDQIARGQTQPIPQDPAQATRARRLRKDDGDIAWTRSAREIHNRIRAFVAWPRSSTTLTRPAGEPMRVVIDKAHVAPKEKTEAPQDALPGTIVAVGGEELLVQTGDGLLAVEAIQPAGKRRMTAGEFARGYRVKPGDRFTESNS